jgi:integrase
VAKFKRLENGFGTVYKLSGNRRRPFIVRKTIGYKDNGQQIFETIGYYETYTAAFTALAEFNKAPFDLSKRNITLKEIAESWYKVEEPKFKPSTIKTLKSTMNKLKPIDHLLFMEIRTDTIQRHVDSLNGINTKKRMKTLFSNLYKYAKSLDLSIKDYSEFVFIKDEVVEKIEKRPFTNEEIKKCWSNKGDILYDAILILLFSGLRPAELMELKKENIHLDKNYMIAGMKTRAGTNRTIPISKYIYPVLERLMNNDKPHLFYNIRKNKMTYKNLHEGMAKLFEHTPHECRHTFISNFDRTEANIGVVKKIVGHSSTDVTEKVYTHKTIEELQEAMKLFDAYMENIIY